jgi:hypothetical protein
MAMTIVSLAGRGYRFIPAVFQYSAGVAAEPGFRLERVRFAEPVPMEEGWKRIAAHLRGLGRPLTALCACELRSPRPFTDDGFVAFNRSYASVLREWGILLDDGAHGNPVARSNVCPEIDPPAEPGFHAFCYTMPDPDAAPSFAAAGSGESMEGNATYRERTVAYGDTSPAGMLAKARHVLGVMEARMAALGFRWAHGTATQVYTVHDLSPFFAGEIVRRGAARHGLTWHLCRPPVIGLDYEMDVRAVAAELVLPA